MKTILLLGAVGLFVAGSALADPTVKPATPAAGRTEERLVFVTGSLIPQRVHLRPLGSDTFSPVRIINRHEIDASGRFTVAGALVNDPAVSIVGR